MKKTIFIFTVAVAFALNTNAQLKVYLSGNVGINATDPVSLFSVGGNGFSDSRSVFHNTNGANSQKALRAYQVMPTGTYAYGLCSTIEIGSTSGCTIGILTSGYRGSTAYTQGQSCGIRAQAGNATSGWNFGVIGEIVGSNNGAAIYATVPGKGIYSTSGMCAGYFRGNVKIEDNLNVLGVFTNSDINLKKDIENLDANNVEKIRQLQAIKYKLKNPVELNAFSKEVTDTATVLMTKDELNDPKYTKEYIGISAQEIQKVYPEIVKTEENGYLSVNYIALIPILMEAIKEQQVTIEELQMKMEALMATKD